MNTHASEIIEELKRLIEIHGDVPVHVVDKHQFLARPILDIRYSSGNSLQKPHIKIIGES